MANHDLKILPEYFNAVNSGIKTFEIRKNDRKFQIGDTLILREIFNNSKEYTGRMLRKEVTYITDYEQKEGCIVMSIK